MATHSSVLAWRVPGTGESGGLPSMESHRVGHDRSDLAAAAAAQLDFRTQIFWLQNHYPPPSQSPTSMCYVYLNSYCGPGGEAATAHSSHLTGWATGSRRWRQPATRDILALRPLRLPLTSPCCVIAPQRGRNYEQGKNNKDSELIGHPLGGLQTNALGTSIEKLPGGVPAPAPQEGIMCVLRSCPLPLQCCCLWSSCWSGSGYHFLLTRSSVLL